MDRRSKFHPWAVRSNGSTEVIVALCSGRFRDENRHHRCRERWRDARTRLGAKSRSRDFLWRAESDIRANASGGAQARRKGARRHPRTGGGIRPIHRADDAMECLDSVARAAGDGYAKLFRTMPRRSTRLTSATLAGDGQSCFCCGCHRCCRHSPGRGAVATRMARDWRKS